MRKIAAFIGLAVYACAVCFAAEQGGAEQAFQRLSSARFFAFGGVGIVGSTSDGEKAFQDICAGTNALPLFKAALTNDNAAARLYALCGIRRFEPESFDHLSKRLVSANPKVMVMRGCIMFEEPASKLVSQIKNGFYDAEIKALKVSATRTEESRRPSTDKSENLVEQGAV